MKKLKIYSWALLLVMILQVAVPTTSWALTGGPSQPEFQSFTPIGTTEMVNLPSGGFTYNIPLMDVGGYPLNLAYNSGITADTEASCVGLGWTINPGVVNRSVRALPDDFKGDQDTVTKSLNIRRNNTVGLSVASSIELFGIDMKKTGFKADLNLGITLNNYTGMGYEFGLSPSFNASKKLGLPLSAKVGLKASSDKGINFNPSVSMSFSKTTQSKSESEKEVVTRSTSGTMGLGLSANSRAGLKALNVSTQLDFESSSLSIEKFALAFLGYGSFGSDDIRKSSNGTSTSASFSYAGKSYSPMVSAPMYGNSINFNFTPHPALAWFGSNSAASFSGYFSTQGLKNKTSIKKPYGMLYAHVPTMSDNGIDSPGLDELMDFNRDKESVYSDYDVSIPSVSPGYDVLSVSGQGIGGSFQLKRSDVPIFYDSQNTSISRGGSLGIEMGNGGLLHGGVDVAANRHKSESRKWKGNNEIHKLLNHSGDNAVLEDYNFYNDANTPYEASYFKKAGELAVESDIDFYNDLGKNEAVRADLNKKSPTNFEVSTNRVLLNESNKPVTTDSLTNRYRKQRERRAQTIGYKTAEEAKHVGLSQKIEVFTINDFSGNPSSTEFRVNDDRKPNHISELESVRPDGLRYVYGIPAYNLHQEETTFNTEGNAVDCATGKVAYDAYDVNATKKQNKQVDNGLKNQKGDDNYYNSTTTSAYAHSFLLTAVLSQDYEDRTLNGLSVDDYGSYTKINYTKPLPEPYKWRVPFEKDHANYNRGLISKKSDDKGSYLYGAKEIWLVHSIESKTMVAEFHYEERHDGWGVQDHNGGFTSNSNPKNHNKKLAKIVLYSKADKALNGSNATPIKTVYFDYQYTLCGGTPNSKTHPTENPSKGKLTLKEVYFTYGHSQRGRLSGYEFNYKNESDNNFVYDMKSYDRWGSYKKNYTNGNCAAPLFGSTVSNDEFPYSEQDAGTANKEAGTWSLNNIKLPSGGEINVEYAAKHYAYVQDKHAMRMIEVAGFSNDQTVSLGDELFDIQNNKVESNNRMYFHLDDPSVSPTKLELKNQYLRGLSPNSSYLYIRSMVAMTSKDGSKADSPKEYVSLYAQYSNYGDALIDGSYYGYLDLKPLPIDGKGSLDNLNPISKFSLQFLREFLPKYAYDKEPITPSKFMSNFAVKPLISMLKQMATTIRGFNNTMTKRGYCRKVDLTRTHVRLTDPDKMKYGGGCMVKRITISDNWSDMVGTGNGDTKVYGQEYDYTTVEEGKVISSGVASYEPMTGGDENPFREPVVISEKRKWAIDNVHYLEKPYCESLMPGPQVVFSEIKVNNFNSANLESPQPNRSRNATGYSIMKYFTARDFPVQVRTTDLQKVPKRISPIFKLLMVKTRDHLTNSQGFVVERNNMHGQAESKEVYDNNNSLISKVEYFYKRDGNKLVNKADVIHADGTITKDHMIGLDYHLSGDSRHSQSDSFNAGAAINMDAFYAGLPVAVPVILPQYEAHQTRYRSMSMTKVIDRVGILEKVVAFDLGSKIETENVAWDAETGEVLLTRTQNEFEDDIFNLKLPAHMHYEGMQGAYQNIGLKSVVSKIAGGLFYCQNAQYLIPGDEVLAKNVNGTFVKKMWVLHTDDNTNQIFLIDENGAEPNYQQPDFSSIKVIRSGHRNMPTASIGSITSKKNPIDYSDKRLVFEKSSLTCGYDLEVLNAGAVEYDEKWQTFYSDPVKCDGTDVKAVNPFIENIRGNWKPKKSWVQLQERKRDGIASSSTDIRENGNYANFYPFWKWNFDPTSSNCGTEENLEKFTTDWTWTTEVTKFNPNGTELENRDILDRHSAEIVGFYDQLVTGVAANAEYTQIAFDGFEDYKYTQALTGGDPCNDTRHFKGIDPGLITPLEYHTGKYALLVGTTPVVVSVSLDPLAGTSLSPSPNSVNDVHYLQKDEIIKPFSPKDGKYVITAWVKEGDGLGEINYQNHSLTVNLLGTSSTQTIDFKAKGKIIEGWQRIEGVFTIPKAGIANTVEDIEIVFKATGISKVYFDDLRIFPFDGDMKNFVYDDVSLKLMAELDANAYATFYEYDASGELIRIKKETERGIMTIQESRSAQPKMN